jgi:hypothetical protein
MLISNAPESDDEARSIWRRVLASQFPTPALFPHSRWFIPPKRTWLANEDGIKLETALGNVLAGQGATFGQSEERGLLTLMASHAVADGHNASAWRTEYASWIDLFKGAKDFNKKIKSIIRPSL